MYMNAIGEYICSYCDHKSIVYTVCMCINVWEAPNSINGYIQMHSLQTIVYIVHYIEKPDNHVLATVL